MVDLRLLHDHLDGSTVCPQQIVQDGRPCLLFFPSLLDPSHGACQGRLDGYIVRVAHPAAVNELQVDDEVVFPPSTLGNALAQQPHLFGLVFLSSAHMMCS